ncbi:hypothetical protein AAMO2058_000269300 [Amorphochlora amoebiformis]
MRFEVPLEPRTYIFHIPSDFYIWKNTLFRTFRTSVASEAHKGQAAWFPRSKNNYSNEYVPYCNASKPFAFGKRRRIIYKISCLVVSLAAIISMKCVGVDRGCRREELLRISDGFLAEDDTMVFLRRLGDMAPERVLDINEWYRHRLERHRNMKNKRVIVLKESVYMRRLEYLIRYHYYADAHSNPATPHTLSTPPPDGEKPPQSYPRNSPINSPINSPRNSPTNLPKNSASPETMNRLSSPGPRSPLPGSSDAKRSLSAISEIFPRIASKQPSLSRDRSAGYPRWQTDPNRPRPAWAKMTVEEFMSNYISEDMENFQNLHERYQKQISDKYYKKYGLQMSDFHPFLHEHSYGPPRPFSFHQNMGNSSPLLSPTHLSHPVSSHAKSSGSSLNIATSTPSRPPSKSQLGLTKSVTLSDVSRRSPSMTPGMSNTPVVTWGAVLGKPRKLNYESDMSVTQTPDVLSERSEMFDYFDAKEEKTDTCTSNEAPQAKKSRLSS